MTDVLDGHTATVQNAIEGVQRDAVERRLPRRLFSNEPRVFVDHYKRDIAEDADAEDCGEDEPPSQPSSLGCRS